MVKRTIEFELKEKNNTYKSIKCQGDQNGRRRSEMNENNP